MRTITMLRMLWSCPMMLFVVLRILAIPSSRAHFDKAYTESQAFLNASNVDTMDGDEDHYSTSDFEHYKILADRKIS